MNLPVRLNPFAVRAGLALAILAINLGAFGLSGPRPVAAQECGQVFAAPDQVILFADANFCGDYEIFTEASSNGDLRTRSSLGNNRASSIKIGADVRAVVCNDFGLGWGDECNHFAFDDVNLIDERIGDDRVSSVYVGPGFCSEMEPVRSEVILYEEANFGGRCTSFFLEPTARWHNLANTDTNVGDDDAASIRIGHDVKATLCPYQNGRGGGECAVFDDEAWDRDLGDNVVGRDQTSSIRVEWWSGA